MTNIVSPLLRCLQRKWLLDFETLPGSQDVPSPACALVALPCWCSRGVTGCLSLMAGFTQDQISGRQWWTITAAAEGGYTIRVLTGREDCDPLAPYLGTVACGANTVSLVSADAGGGLQTWTFTPTPTPTIVPQPPFVPYFANGTYSIFNTGRPTCANGLAYDACTVDADVFLNATASMLLPCSCALMDHSCPVGTWVHIAGYATQAILCFVLAMEKVAWG